MLHVVAAFWAGEDVKHSRIQIDYPVFRNARSGIHELFAAKIIFQRRVGDLNDEQCVIRSWMTVLVGFLAHNSQVWHRLTPAIQAHGVLAADTKL